MKNKRFIKRFYSDMNSTIKSCHKGNQVFSLYFPYGFQYHVDFCRLLGCGFYETCSRFGFCQDSESENVKDGILQLFLEEPID